MDRKQFLASGAAALALAVTAASAAASSPAVKIRIEGLTKTLLPTTVVHAGTGFITTGGTPKGSCPAASGAGALDVATHHKWDGSWDPKYQALSVTSILGESHKLTSTNYWSIWVNNAYAPAGICGLKLHAGDTLLFAAVPDTPTEYPLGLSGPGTAAAGKAFTVKTVAYNGSGKAKPLAGVTVSGGGVRATSNSHGVATITGTRAGKLVLHASEKDYVRAATLTVRVK